MNKLKNIIFTFVIALCSLFVINVDAATTIKENSEDYWKASNLLKGYIKIYENMNKFSDYRYKNTFDRMTANVNLLITIVNPEIELSYEEYKEVLKNTDYNTKMKIKFILRIRFKKVYMFIKRIKKAYKGEKDGKK